MSNAKERMLQILEDTIKFFNKNNLSISTRCCYLSPNGNKCAVGRLMTDEELKKWHEFEEANHNSGDGTGYIDGLDSGLRVSALENLPTDFVCDLQELHDTRPYWNENGLSDRGRQFYERIKAMIVDGFY